MRPKGIDCGDVPNKSGNIQSNDPILEVTQLNQPGQMARMRIRRKASHPESKVVYWYLCMFC